MAIAPVQLAAFTLSITMTSYRSPSERASSQFQLDLTTFDLDSGVEQTRRRLLLSGSERDDVCERWELKLFNDAINTRSYICRCLVEAAEQSEEDSYLKMQRAHEQGEATIGEYSCEEHADHYRYALESRGINCGIFLVEE